MLTRHLRRITVAMAAAAALVPALALAAPHAHAQDDGDDEPTIFVDFETIKLDRLIDLAQSRLGLQIIFNPNEAGVNLSTMEVRYEGKNEVTVAELRNILHASLASHKLAMVPAGDPKLGLRRIVPLDLAARYSLAEFSTIEELEAADVYDQVVTLTIRLQHADANQVAVAFQRFHAEVAGGITAVQGANAVSITDFAGNVLRLGRTVMLMDQPMQVDVERYQLDFAAADVVAEHLEGLLETLTGGDPAARGGRGASNVPGRPAPQIIPLPANNTLVVAAVPEHQALIADLVRSLDTDQEGLLRIYVLENSRADHAASAIQGLFGGRIAPGPTPEQRTRRGISGGGIGEGGGSDSTQPSQPSRVSGGDEEAPDDRIVIVPDMVSNRLMIRAPNSLHEEISRLIERVDARVPQVWLEAIVVEVSEGDSRDLGIETALGTYDEEGFSRFLVSSFGLSDATVDLDALRVDRVIDPEVLNDEGAIAGLVQNGEDLPVIIKALEEADNAEILSIPKVLTRDNLPALFQSIRTERVQRDAGAQSVGGFEEINAGIVFEVTPRISRESFLNLEIRAEASEFGARPAADEPPPVNSNVIHVEVTVPNNRILVLGGLQRERETVNESRVPWLADIPWVGTFFESTSTEKRLSTLYIFLRPRILTDDGFNDLIALSDDIVHGTNLAMDEGRFRLNRLDTDPRGTLDDLYVTGYSSPWAVPAEDE